MWNSTKEDTTMIDNTNTKSNNRLDSLEFFIKAYSYTAEENRIFMDHEILIRICSGKDLSVSKMFWKDEKFAAVPGEGLKELTGAIFENGKKWKDFTVKFVPPGEDYHDFWYLGVSLFPGNKIRLAVGNKDKFSLSGEISLQ